MSLFKRYCVLDWNGKEHWLTARELYKRVMKDSETSHNWFVSAREIVRVCQLTEFPAKYAHEIEIAILKHFTDLEKAVELRERTQVTDDFAVNTCYNSLAGVSKKADEARNSYLNAVINNVIESHWSIAKCRYEEYKYRLICKMWKDVTFEEYKSMPTLQFQKLRKELKDELAKMLATEKTSKHFEEFFNPYSPSYLEDF